MYATVAAAQLVVAWVWLLPQWAVGIRPVPKPSPSEPRFLSRFLPRSWALTRFLPWAGNMQALQKVSLLHGFGHLVTVLSMGLGAVSFVHVVKAAEPGPSPPPLFPSHVFIMLHPLLAKF
eukprot:1843814-Rhodomonas_salina.3